jgi:hypothetical protein
MPCHAQDPTTPEGLAPVTFCPLDSIGFVSHHLTPFAKPIPEKQKTDCAWTLS